MRKISIATLCAAAVLSACATGPSPLDRLRSSSIGEVRGHASMSRAFLAGGGSESQMEERAKEAISNQLKDPASAQFRNVRAKQFDDSSVVCGEVNAKNSYGGYIGFKQFVASPSGGTIEHSGSRYPQIDAAANAGIYLACGA